VLVEAAERYLAEEFCLLGCRAVLSFGKERKKKNISEEHRLIFSV
jgi:hypothetical protein